MKLPSIFLIAILIARSHALENGHLYSAGSSQQHRVLHNFDLNFSPHDDYQSQEDDQLPDASQVTIPIELKFFSSSQIHEDTRIRLPASRSDSKGGYEGATFYYELLYGTYNTIRNLNPLTKESWGGVYVDFQKGDLSWIERLVTFDRNRVDVPRHRSHIKQGHGTNHMDYMTKHIQVWNTYFNSKIKGFFNYLNSEEYRQVQFKLKMTLPLFLLKNVNDLSPKLFKELKNRTQNKDNVTRNAVTSAWDFLEYWMGWRRPTLLAFFQNSISTQNKSLLISMLGISLESLKSQITQQIEASKRRPYLVYGNADKKKKKKRRKSEPNETDGDVTVEVADKKKKKKRKPFAESLTVFRGFSLPKS